MSMDQASPARQGEAYAKIGATYAVAWRILRSTCTFFAMRQRAWVIGTTLATVVAVASCSASEGPSRPLLAPQDPERTEIGQAKSAITVPLETENWEIVRMPTRRSPPSYVYDPLRGEGTLFGNSFAEDSKSTWVWNGHNFLEYVTRRGMKTPGARFGPALAWDPERKNVVLPTQISSGIRSAKISSSTETAGRSPTPGPSTDRGGPSPTTSFLLLAPMRVSRGIRCGRTWFFLAAKAHSS